MIILFLRAFGEENLEGKNDKNEISLLRSSLFKIYRFFLEFGGSVNWGHV